MSGVYFLMPVGVDFVLYQTTGVSQVFPACPGLPSEDERWSCAQHDWRRYPANFPVDADHQLPLVEFFILRNNWFHESGEIIGIL